MESLMLRYKNFCLWCSLAPRWWLARYENNKRRSLLAMIKRLRSLTRESD